jgi:hypothetical protein
MPALVWSCAKSLLKVIQSGTKPIAPVKSACRKESSHMASFLGG